MAFFLPLFHNLDDRKCLLVGAGATGLRKLRWLLQAGASVTVVAPVVSDEIERLEGQLAILRRPFEVGDVHPDLALVVSAANDAQVNKAVHARCVEVRVPVNCVDQPELCTVVFPAIVDRSPVVVAVSSSARSPTLSRMVRSWIEARLPKTLSNLSELVDRTRSVVRNKLASTAERKTFWEQVLGGEPGRLALAGRMADAEAATRAHLTEAGTALGRVTLVGAGPGDPELITVKGQRALQEADVILYDKLVNVELLEYARRDARRIDVGKQGPKPGNAVRSTNTRSHQQADINRLLVEHASQGKHVVRLKGGDPFVFGRGGEELEAAVEAGIVVDVIPGISAAFGVASMVGIPLTYRNLSQSIRFITGHRVDNLTNMDWPELGKADQTLVIYMGLVGLPKLVANLISHGLEPSTPSALVENATLPEQRTLFSPVGKLADRAERAGIDGPSTIVIGAVVGKAPSYSG